MVNLAAKKAEAAKTLQIEVKTFLKSNCYTFS
jgi:hypothetical protein